MQTLSRSQQRGGQRDVRHSVDSSRAVFAFCILNFALLLTTSGCAKSPPTFPSAPKLDPIQVLRHDVLAAAALPGVQHAAWGIVVHSLDRDERLVDLNPRTLLVPASSAKMVSVASGAEAVGWDFQFQTTLQSSGTISDGVLHGDLIVVGSGDPSIGGRSGNDLGQWIEALKAQGIRRIDGRIIGDDDAIEEPRPALAWTWDDLGYPTGALFGALNFGENRTTVSVAPGATAGEATIVTSERSAGPRSLVNRSVTGAAGSMQLLWPEQRPGEPFLTIAGSIPIGARAATLAISAGNPTLWFADVFRQRLIRSGIEVTGDASDIDDLTPKPDRTAARTLFTYRSPPLSEIAVATLKDSINLYGEAFLRLNVAPGVFPTNDAALDGLRKRLSQWGVPADGQQLVDGSGLSRRDVITPEALLIVLRHMYDAAGASPWMRALAIAGVDGTLENRMKGTPAESNVRAKSGTMSNVRTLAGYVTTRDGERLAFVVMVNNFEGSGAQAIQAIDGIAVRLAGFSRR
jgi:serine-type D-Ala-D-Ala carboxypeptidase/endopeptidase (penicillin-binding protein 4)